MLQYTAAMIVIAGTAGAVMVTTPPSLLLAALRRIKDVLWDTTPSTALVTAQLLEFARQARRTGIVSLEAEMEKISDPFFRKALLLAVDGMDLQDLRRVMELEIEISERRGEAEAKVFETAGGYAPDDRHYRSGAGPDPGHETSRRHRARRPRHCSRLRRDGVRRRSRQPSPASHGEQAQGACRALRPF